MCSRDDVLGRIEISLRRNFWGMMGDILHCVQLTVGSYSNRSTIAASIDERL